MRGSKRQSDCAALRVAILAAMSGGFGGCTALSDFAVHQCDSQDDCSSLSEAAYCKDSRCVRGCTTNEECARFDPRLPICQHPGGGCVGLLSDGPECFSSTSYHDATMGELTARDMIIIGAFADSVTSSEWLTAQLVADEINAAGGLPGPRKRQPVMIVFCDGHLQIDSIRHLVTDLESSAILASLDDAALRDVLDQPELVGRAFFLSPNASASSLPSGDESDLLWYLGAQERDVLDAYLALIERITVMVGERNGPEASPRLASVAGAEAEDITLSRDVARLLAAGGIDTDGSDPRGPYRTFDLFGESPLDPNTELEALVSYQPDAVLLFAAGTYATMPKGAFGSPLLQRASVMRALDEATTTSPAFQPVYVLGPRGLSDSAPMRLAADSSQFRTHAVALRAGRARDENVAAAVAGRFAAAFPNVEPSRTGLGVAYDVYDALYTLAYAVAAAPAHAGRLSGENVFHGFSRITEPSAELVTVGPGAGSLERAIELLEEQSSFDLSGTSGIGDFDPTSRARPGPTRLYCWDERGGVREGALFERAAGVFLRTSDVCPPGFSE